VVVLRGKSTSLVVHLSHQRAGRVYGPQASVLGLITHHESHAMGGKDHERALRDLIGLLDEERAALLQRPDHMGVMHYLLANVNRCAESLQSQFHRLDSPIHPSAVAAGLGKYDSSGLD